MEYNLLHILYWMYKDVIVVVLYSFYRFYINNRILKNTVHCMYYIWQ